VHLACKKAFKLSQIDVKRGEKEKTFFSRWREKEKVLLSPLLVDFSFFPQTTAIRFSLCYCIECFIFEFCIFCGKEEEKLKYCLRGEKFFENGSIFQNIFNLKLF
jgi:hypothetical protein